MGAKLTGVETAREMVLSTASALPAEEVPLADALGRVLAEPVAGTEPVPALDNSAMDGFAVIAADTEGASSESPVELRLAGESAAGHPWDGDPLEPGTAIRISTGAAVPAGADAVVRVEDTDDAAGGGSVRVMAAVAAGRDIRRAGEDVKPGDVLVAAGTPIGPSELGVLASAPRTSVSCVRRPTVGLVFTGDELLEPGEPMRPGGVRNTNAWAVPALARLAGAEVASTGRAGDDPGATREAVAEALEADVAVICGGVSVGPHDHVRPALQELGARERFWGVGLRPGKPTWFGTAGGSTPSTLAFGLPGNPVSAIVTFILFVRPALRALAGADPPIDRAVAVLDEPYEKPAGRTHAIRVGLTLADDGWHARPTRAAQASHVLTSMLGADALAMIPADSEGVAAGGRVEVELLPRV